MNNDNVVKIGTALKWRNTFDLTKKYYQENVVTACGCVFRCKVLQAQGKSPIKMTDDQGHIVYTNTDVWDVLVDMAYYYNYAVDTKKLTQQMLDYTKKLDEAFQKQQKEIEAIQKDNKDQWDHINAIEKVNDEQQRELNAIFDTISCFSEGIWIDTLLWSNETIWDNNKYAITDDLQNQINELTETHRQDIEDLTEKHNSEISKLAAHIVQREKYQDGINDYLQDQVYDLNNTLSCFSTGVWENDLHWSQLTLWDNNKYAITDALSEDIKALDKRVNDNKTDFDKAVLENSKEHGLVNAHLQKHDKEIKDLQDLIAEHDQQIIDLIDTLCCFSSGQWDNGLKWSNKALWENSNQMIDTFEDIYSKIEEHQKAIENLIKEIQRVQSEAAETLKSINQTFGEFRKEHEAFRKEHEAFGKEHETFREEHQKFTDRLDGHDTQNEEQQREIDTLLYRISVITNGVWDNNLLWINDSEWVNSNLNGSCHCPEDTEERLDELQNGLEAVEQRVSDTETRLDDAESGIDTNSGNIAINQSAIADNASEIEKVKEDAVTEHRAVAYQLRTIGREQTAQNDNLAKLGEHFSCYADGIWGNLFIWDNELLWANQSGVVNEAISDLRNDLRDTRQKLDEANEDIITNLSLIRANHQLIEANSADIQDNKETIEDTQSELHTITDEIRKEALAEHRQVAYQLRAIGRDQEVQNENIAKLGEHFSCFADGVWGDLFLWDNDRLWANSTGVIIRALEEIHDELDFHQDTLDAIIEEKDEHFSCFHDDVWCNSSLWRNDHLWSFSVADIVSAFQKQDEEIQAIQKSAKENHSQIAVEIINIENSISEVKYDIAEIQTKIESNTSLIQKNQEHIDANSESIADNEKNIQNLNNEIERQSEEFHNKLLSEHRQIAYQLRALNREQAAQDENVAQIGCHFNCFANGLWGNHFLWNNDSLWANEPGVIESAFNDVNTELNVHKETLDSILNEQAEHFDCFGNDVWCNSSVWKNDRMWPGNCIDYSLAIQKLEDSTNETSKSLQVFQTQSTTEFSKINDTLQTADQKISEIATSLQEQTTQAIQNSESIQKIAEDIQRFDSDTSEAIESLREEAQIEHRQVAYQLRTIGREQTVQDDKITKLGEHFGCFVDGKWCDLFLWNNDHLWHNETGVVEEAIADTNERIDAIENEIEILNQKAEEHQSEYQELLDDIRSYNGCFEKGEWASPFFWNDTDVWYNSPNAVSEAETEIIRHDTRLAALESQFKLFLQQFAAQQTIIDQQQDILETFTDCFTVLNLGRWHNMLFWDNSSKWSDVMITEAAGDGGIASVAVRDYDPATQTVSI